MTDHEHWIRWHEAYEDPLSSLSRRLAVVQQRLGQALDEAPKGTVQLISICAGQGRDVIGVLGVHDRRKDVKARMVERDHALVEDSRVMAERAGLSNLEIQEGDASTTTAYVGAAPADVILVCGVFGNVSKPDIYRTVVELPRLVGRGAVVIWTRHRLEPDLTPTIRSWFNESNFEEVAFDKEEGTSFGVGTHRFVGNPQPFEPGRRLFTFLGDGADARL